MESVTIRYFFHGEAPENCRLLRVNAAADTSTQECYAALSKAVDLYRFEPHVRSPGRGAFVPLSEFDASELSCILEGGQALQICLFPASASLMRRPVADTQLECDSGATMLSGSFFGIGIVRGRAVANHGTVWRTALQLGASFTFTVGAAYSRKVEGPADVYKCSRQIPCIAYTDEDALAAGTVVGAEWVAVEAGGESLRSFSHPKHALYILGAEVEGLSPSLVAKSQYHVTVDVAPGRPGSMNVAAVAAVVLWDRVLKSGHGPRVKPDLSSGETADIGS